MEIKRLKLNNFRNYSDLDVDFDDFNNIIYGLNAQGKTNLIESIYFLSTFKSFRTSKNKEIINFNADFMSLECDFRQKNKEYTLKVSYNRENKYEILLNGVKYKSKNQVLGFIKTVVFCPDDLFLIKSSPDLRRDFLNSTLIQFRPKYQKLLSDYNKYIKNKSFILKNYDEKPSLLDVLDDYNLHIARLCAEISYMRANFLNFLSEHSSEIYDEISGGLEKLSLSYISKLPNTSVEENFTTCLELLNIYKEKEKASKNCLIGVHKDDILFKINENPAREYASQGQIRSIVLSLKLGVRELFYKDTSTNAILILDDVLSELDETRQDFVLRKIKDGQVLITTPYFDKLNLSGKLICIENGLIKE